ncbi:MAG: phage tail tape measure protein [Paracoccaceae bacterium]
MQDDDLDAALSRGLDGARGDAAGLAAEMAEATRAMRAMDEEAKRLSRSLGTSLGRAFKSAAFGGKGLGDAMRSLVSDVSGRALDAALHPIERGIGDAIGGAFSGLLGFAKGGAFSAGRVRAFAKGGVVDGPTLFPMRGATGLMGEAGPEAIMPLTRGADGRLGVRAEGGAGRAPSVTVNVSTPDVAGFRRSRGQIAAAIARASAQGQRRL